MCFVVAPGARRAVLDARLFRFGVCPLENAMHAWPRTAEELMSQTDAVVDEVLAAAGWPAPPVDALALARGHFGFDVLLDANQPSRGRAQSNRAGRLIYLRPEPRSERAQWTVAHEIGEHLRPRFVERLGLADADFTPGLGEHLANLFAARLLVPTCWLKDDGPNLRYDLLRLKAIYATAS